MFHRACQRNGANISDRSQSARNTKRWPCAPLFFTENTLRACETTVKEDVTVNETQGARALETITLTARGWQHHKNIRRSSSLFPSVFFFRALHDNGRGVGRGAHEAESLKYRRARTCSVPVRPFTFALWRQEQFLDSRSMQFISATFDASLHLSAFVCSAIIKKRTSRAFNAVVTEALEKNSCWDRFFFLCALFSSPRFIEHCKEYCTRFSRARLIF